MIFTLLQRCDEFISEPSPENLKLITKFCLKYPELKLGPYLMSFYDKESEEYKEYIDAFYLSPVKILFKR